MVTLADNSGVSSASGTDKFYVYPNGQPAEIGNAFNLKLNVDVKKPKAVRITAVTVIDTTDPAQEQPPPPE